MTFEDLGDTDSTNDVYRFTDSESITFGATTASVVDIPTAGITSIDISMDTGGNPASAGLTVGGLAVSGDVSLKSTTVTLSSLISSDSKVTIEASGAITNVAGMGPVIAAVDLVMTTTGDDSAIGEEAEPIRTSIGSLTAASNDGGIFIADSNSGPGDSGMVISDVVAKEDGKSPLVNGKNQVVIDFSNSTVGTFDVSISAEGSIVLGSVTAPDAITINATSGMIVDANQASPNLLGRSASLLADQSIGQQSDPIELSSESFSANAVDGSVYLAEGIVGSLTSLVAGGTAHDVEVTSTGSTLRLGSITAAGTVTVTNNAGALVDANGAALNITSEKVVLTGKSGVGTSADPLETTTSEIVANASDTFAPIGITETDGLTSVSAKTNDGNVAVNFGGGSLIFTSNSDLLNASGAAVTFETTGGSISLGVVDAGSGIVSITASAAIKDDSDSAVDVKGSIVTLSAVTGIGTSGDQIETDADELIATTTAGELQIREANALILSRGTAGSTVDVRNATGDLTVKAVSTSGPVTLHAGGAIIDGNANAVNVFGSSLDLLATNGIGTSSDAFEMAVSTLTVDGGAGGGVFVSNSKALTLTSLAAGGGDVSLTNNGNLTLSAVNAAGRSVTVSAAGDLVDGNDATLNFTAASLTLSAAKIGTAANKFETSAGTISAVASLGGVFLSNTGVTNLNLSATANGLGADLDIDSTGDIVLDVAAAGGDRVTLSATGAITDGNDTATTKPVNLTAKTLDITAPGGIGTSSNPLEGAVDEILNATGGGSAAALTNDGPLQLREEALEFAGTGDLIFDAESITIVDIADNRALVGLNRNVVLRTQTGHIVFNDPADTIETQGTGSITVQAGTIAGSRGAAVLGNLKTAGQNITVTADWNITVGQFDAGTTGNVSVQSRAGLIVDGNGPELNVIAQDAIVRGVTPTLRQAELDEITKISDFAGKRGEAAAKKTSYDAFFAASVIASAAEVTWENEVDDAQTRFDKAEDDVDDQTVVVDALTGVKLGLDITAFALDVAASIAEAVADAAQAIPVTGDGGSSSIAGGLGIAAKVASGLAIAADVALTVADGVLGELEDALVEAQAELFAAEATLGLATETKNAFLEAVSITLAASTRANIARDAAGRLSDQATLARDQNNAMSTPDQPLGMRVSGVATLTAPNSTIYLDVTGSATIRAGSLEIVGGNPDAITLASPGVKWTLNNNETIGSLAGVAGSNVFLGSNTVTTGRNNTDTTYSGVINGTGGAVTKVGTGTFTLAGTNTYTGATTVSAGRLNVNGSTAVESTVTVQNSATLGGTGTIAGTTNVLTGGTASPGTSPGVLRTANLTFNSGSTFSLEIAGTTPGNGVTNYDQVVVTGNNRTISLGGAELVFNLIAAPRAGSGQVYRIIDSTGTGSNVTGTFQYHGFKLNDGNVFTVDNTIFRINYNPIGAPGDVTLTEIPAQTLASLAGGILTITDTSTVSNDDLTLRLDANGNVLFHDPLNGIAGAGGVLSEQVPLSSLTQIVINVGIGVNSLLLDFTNGNPIPAGGLIFNGGNKGVDSLTLNNLGTPFSSVTYQPTNLTDATFQLVRTGSQPILVSARRTELMALDGTQAANLIVDMPTSNDTVILTDLTGSVGAGKERLTPIGFPIVDFTVTGISNLTVNGNNGNDTLLVSSLNRSFGAGITLNGGEGNDIIDAGGSQKLVGTTIRGIATYQTGGNGSDLLVGGVGNDTLDGGAGNDTIHGNSGNDAILGGAGSDVLFGNAGADTIAGGAGNDLMLGGGGNDVLAGQDGIDTVRGETGSDTVAGGSGLGRDAGDDVNDSNNEILRETLLLVFNDTSKLFDVLGV